MIRKLLITLAALALPLAAQAQLYPLFGPSNGIMKGSAATPQTSSAVSSDVTGLFSGGDGCTGTNRLAADGHCYGATSGAPGSNTQVIFNNSGALGASSLFTFTPGTVVANIGGSTTPGTFSVGTLDSMVVNGVTVPIPGFALNSNIQGVFENHSYVNGVAAGGARYYGVRSEGTISSPAIVVNGDHLSTFYAAGYNGSSYSLGGSMTWLVDGTPGASAMPSDVDIALSPAGSQVPASVLKLYGTGSYGVNGSQGTAGNVLLSGGTGAAAWGTLNLASAAAVTNNLPVTHGGTGVATLTGLVLGNGTAAFSAATSANVISLWSGTCSSTTFLRGDGQCTTAGGGGTPGGANTNVQFNNAGSFGGDSSFTYAGAGGAVTAPTLAVTSSTVPVNGLYLPAANTLGIATNTTARIAIGSTGDVGYGNSSQNVATLGTNIPTVQLNGGNTTRTGGVRGRSSDSSVDWAMYGDSGGGGLNFGTITNTVVSFQKNNATVMQFSSAATGRQVDIVANGSTSTAVGYVGFVDTSGTRYGYFGKSSTGSTISYESDASVQLVANNGADTLFIDGTHVLQYGSTPVINVGTFTMTYNGFSAGCSLGATYTQAGRMVTLVIPGSAVCASNATTFTATGIPSAIQPAQAQQLGMFPSLCEDNSVIGGFTCGANISAGTITFSKNNSASGWTASGQKGITTNLTVTYLLN